MPAYQRHSATSKAAADQFAGKAETIREQVFKVFESRLPEGLTDDEAYDSTGLKPNTCRARRCELVKEGRLVDRGLTRPGNEGLEQTVWFADPSVPPKKTLNQLLKEHGCKKLDDYYSTEHWVEFRESYWSRHRRVCFVTGSATNLDLHHLHYETIFAETDADVVPLRRDVHEFVEKIIKDYGIPRQRAHLLLVESRAIFSMEII